MSEQKGASPEHDATGPNRTAKATLRSIYEDGGSIPDMSKLDRTRDHRWARSFGYFVGIVLLASAVAWFAFRLFIPSSPGDMAAISIQTPEQVTAGSKMTVVIHYENRDHNPLALAVLKFRYPKEFIAESVTPRADDESLTTWTLGTVDRNSSGTIEIQGRVVGSIGTNADLQSTLTYKPAQFNAEFTSVATKIVAINTAPIELTFDGAPEAASGESVTFTVRFKNVSPEPLTNAQLVFTPGAAFSLTKSSKKPLHDMTWAIPALDPGAVGELTLTGIVTSEAQAQTSLPFKVVTMIKRTEVVLTQGSYGFTVAQGELGVSLTRDGDAPVQLGDALPLTLVVTNNGTVPLGDISLQLTTSTTGMVDWAQSNSPVTIAARAASVSWNAATAPLLKTIKPGEHLTIPVNLKTTITNATTVPSIIFSASAKAAKRLDKTVALSAKSADFVVALGSNVGADIYALYYNEAGAALGSGPLPPRVGEETLYRIIWKIKNGVRDLVDVSLSAALPRDMRFIAKQGVGAGSLGFDEDTRIIRWTVSRLPATVNEIVAQFDIGLTPITNDQGNVLELMGSATLIVTDELIHQDVREQLPHLTTDLTRDQKGRGKGVVLP